MAFHIEWAKKYALLRFSGHVTANDVHNANERYFSDYRIDSIDCSIWDFSSVETVSKVADSDLEQYAALDFGASLYLPKQKVALIASREDVRGYCVEYKRICDSLGHGWQVELFDGMDDAFAWCGCLP